MGHHINVRRKANKYTAYFEEAGFDGCYGFGSTQVAALDDLAENFPEYYLGCAYIAPKPLQFLFSTVNSR